MKNTNNSVLFLRQENYNQPEIDSAVSRVFETLGHGEGVRHFVKRGDKVLLKVNLIAGHAPERRVTTDPAIVRAVAKLVLDCGGQPVIADSPGIDNFRATAERAKLADVANELGIPCVELLDPVLLPTPSGAFRTFKKIEVARLVRDSDVIINLPKLKTHSQMTLTLGVKNLFGCIVGQAKAAWHYNVGLSRDNFADLLLDIVCSLAAGEVENENGQSQNGNLKLTIVDGVIGMDGAGPTGGKPYPYGVIAAAEGMSVLSMDFCLCQMMGVKLENFPLWRAAKRRSMSQCEGFDKNLVGDLPFVGASPFKFHGVNIPQQNTLRLLPWMPACFERALASRPVHVPEKCIGCGRCQSVCAAGALKHENKHVTFDYSRCIRCYCCHEMCPVQAIDFRESPIIKLGRKVAPLASKLQHIFDIP